MKQYRFDRSLPILLAFRVICFPLQLFVLRSSGVGLWAHLLFELCVWYILFTTCSMFAMLGTNAVRNLIESCSVTMVTPPHIRSNTQCAIVNDILCIPKGRLAQQCILVESYGQLLSFAYLTKTFLLGYVQVVWLRARIC